MLVYIYASVFSSGFYPRRIQSPYNSRESKLFLGGRHVIVNILILVDPSAVTEVH